MRTQLVGRADVLHALERMLFDTDARLVTLTGPGGVGKTCVARAVADRVRAADSTPIVCVDLAGLSTANLVLAVVAHALGMPECAGAPTPQSVADWIGDRRT